MGVSPSSCIAVDMMKRVPPARHMQGRGAEDAHCGCACARPDRVRRCLLPAGARRSCCRAAPTTGAGSADGAWASPAWPSASRILVGPLCRRGDRGAVLVRACRASLVWGGDPCCARSRLPRIGRAAGMGDINILAEVQGWYPLPGAVKDRRSPQFCVRPALSLGPAQNRFPHRPLARRLRETLAVL
jgi:hypothetical protein